VIGTAVMVARIATSEIEDKKIEKNPHAVALGKLGGIVMKYLRDNPDKRQYTASSDGATALMHAFPCITGTDRWGLGTD
jgi:hypothetical protein